MIFNIRRDEALQKKAFQRVRERIGKWRRIVFFGDSITCRGRMVDLIQLYLTCCYPAVRRDVFNSGYPGASASFGMEHIQQDVMDLKPDAVFVCYGINDVGCGLYNTIAAPDAENQRGRDIGRTSYLENMKSIRESCEAAGMDVIFLTTFPRDNYSTLLPEDECRYLNEYGLLPLVNGLYELAGDRTPVIDIFSAVASLYHDHPELKITEDRVHPDKRGLALAASTIVQALFAPHSSPEALPFPPLPECAGLEEILQLNALYETGSQRRAETSCLLKLLEEKTENIAILKRARMVETQLAKLNMTLEEAIGSKHQQYCEHFDEKYRSYFVEILEEYAKIYDSLPATRQRCQELREEFHRQVACI